MKIAGFSGIWSFQRLVQIYLLGSAGATYVTLLSMMLVVQTHTGNNVQLLPFQWTQQLLYFGLVSTFLESALQISL
jgi:hypothetical protein